MRAPTLILAAALSCGACVAPATGGGRPSPAAEPYARPSPAATPDTPLSASSPRPVAPAPAAASSAGRAEEVIIDPSRAEVSLAVSSPVSRGETVVVTARATAHSECSLLVAGPPGPAAPASPVSKYADGSGNLSWSWTVAPDARPGTWTVDVVCGTPSGLRAFARAPLTVR